MTAEIEFDGVAEPENHFLLKGITDCLAAHQTRRWLHDHPC